MAVAVNETRNHQQTADIHAQGIRMRLETAHGRDCAVLKKHVRARGFFAAAVADQAAGKKDRAGGGGGCFGGHGYFGM
jgi:hypothetical protein